MSEINRSRAECIRCLAGKYPNYYPEDASEEEKIEYMRGALSIIAGAPDSYASPVIVRDINDLHEKMFGNRIQYTAQKPYYNSLLLKEESRLMAEIEAADDPLQKAIQCAIIGNYIDLSAIKNIDEDYLWKAFSDTDRFPLPQNTYASLLEELKRCRKMVFLTDNCGEIVVDKLLIKTIKRRYPQIDITVIVKGAEVQNDASMDDAIQVGLCDEVRVLDNGNNVAGTWLPETKPEALQAIKGADLILSKGQANLETLRGTDLPIYHIFMCKCAMLSRDYNVPVLTGMLLRE